MLQRDLQHLGHIEIAGQVVVLLAKCTRLHTAAGAAIAGILQRLALPDHLLHDDIGVEDRGLTKAGADDLGRPLDETIRILLAQLHRRTGLQQAHLLDHVQEQIGDLIHGIGAIWLDAAGVDLGKIGVGAAFGGGHTNFGRGGLVVELDPEAVQQFLGLFSRQRARRQLLPDRTGYRC